MEKNNDLAVVEGVKQIELRPGVEESRQWCRLLQKMGFLPVQNQDQFLVLLSGAAIAAVFYTLAVACGVSTVLLHVSTKGLVYLVVFGILCFVFGSGGVFVLCGLLYDQYKRRFDYPQFWMWWHRLRMRKDQRYIEAVDRIASTDEFNYRAAQFNTLCAATYNPAVLDPLRSQLNAERAKLVAEWNAACAADEQFGPMGSCPVGTAVTPRKIVAEIEGEYPEAGMLALYQEPGTSSNPSDDGKVISLQQKT